MYKITICIRYEMRVNVETELLSENIVVLSKIL